MIELVAAEPQVASPVAIAWDADGFLYVAEMIDYPVAPPAGRIRGLVDSDRDGVYERATIFADGLSFPNGVLPCFDGVLVTAAPNIWFLRDTDGDGKADERRVVLTGFGEGNTQLRVNGLFWGLDNWIYAANGRSDGEIRTPESPREQAVSMRRRDLRFRFHPKQKHVQIEAIAGFSQFGLAHDDWGNRFPSWNTIPIRHVVLEQAALDRNPYLAETTTVASVLDPADSGRVYSVSPVQARFNRESVDYFNASCGPTIFRGDSLPPAYRGNAFACEPLTNLVHRRVLEPAGCTFVARRAEEKREFLASTDPSFRPVNLTTGPDGALYVVDMYRELVEHPDFVPPDQRSKVEFRRWHDRGRIWRIRSREEASTALRAGRRRGLARAKDVELVKVLDHPVGWYRDTAQRLLVERQDQGTIPVLRDRVQTAVTPLGRLHALWTLQGLGGLDAGDLDRAACDPHPAIREHSLRLAASLRERGPSLPRGRVVALAGDPSVRVRLQAALELGRCGRDDRSSIQSFAALAIRDAADPWLRLSILSSLRGTALPVLRVCVAENPNLLDEATPEQARLLSEAAAILGARRNEEELVTLLRLTTADIRPSQIARGDMAGRMALLAGLGEGLERSGSPLHAWLREQEKGRENVLEAMPNIWSAACSLVLSDQPVDRRQLALLALARGEPKAFTRVLPRVLKSDQPASLQIAAARAAGHLGEAGLTSLLLDRWSELPLGARHELAAALVASRPSREALITALQAGKIQALELDAATRDALLQVADPELKRSAATILASATPADRSTILSRYQAALGLAGDAARGAPLFAKHCQTCHQHRGEGHRVGPDLSGIAGRPPAVLLSDILDPNREVAPDSVAITVATKSGQILSGILAEETGAGLKLRKADGVEETILRSEVAEFRSTGRSLMPEGLEQSLNLQEMADLLRFLSQSGPEVQR
jgi:putative membrane-bound dehydrogenase-like protein